MNDEAMDNNEYINDRHVDEYIEVFELGQHNKCLY